jgi:membrane protease YdiL (CAAX protease family)
MGGYFVSSWLFNISDVLNTYFLPLSVLEAAENSSVVSQLVNPEGRDWLASVVGYLAPCINAPWWEEILYRGFLLPSMFLLLGYKRAVLVSGVLFSIHHSSLPAFLPLCILGWTWAILYTKSQNLWTTIVIHAMWNSRIFLGSWLGV